MAHFFPPTSLHNPIHFDIPDVPPMKGNQVPPPQGPQGSVLPWPAAPLNVTCQGPSAAQGRPPHPHRPSQDARTSACDPAVSTAVNTIPPVAPHPEKAKPKDNNLNCSFDAGIDETLAYLEKLANNPAPLEVGANVKNISKTPTTFPDLLASPPNEVPMDLSPGSLQTPPSEQFLQPQSFFHHQQQHERPNLGQQEIEDEIARLVKIGKADRAESQRRK